MALLALIGVGYALWGINGALFALAMIVVLAIAE